MIIETKYSIGDVVYYIDSNEIKSFEIQAVLVNKHSYVDSRWPSADIQYSSDQYGKKDFISEHLLFTSIDDLTKNLISKYKM